MYSEKALLERESLRCVLGAVAGQRSPEVLTPDTATAPHCLVTAPASSSPLPPPDVCSFDDHVMGKLAEIWACTDANCDGEISRDEFNSMHRSAMFWSCLLAVST